MNILKLLKKWFTIKEIYRCDYCEFKTDGKRGLEIHKGKVHGLKKIITFKDIFEESF